MAKGTSNTPKSAKKNTAAGPGAKLDRRLDARLKEFETAEHGLPAQGAAALHNPATQQAAEEEQAAQQTQEENDEQEEQQQTQQQAEEQKKESAAHQAADIAKDAIRSTAIKAAAPYVVGFLLVVGIILVVIFGIANYKKGLDNPTGPRQVDPVVAGNPRDTQQVNRIAALAGSLPATEAELKKLTSDMQTEIKTLRDKVQKEYGNTPQGQQASAKLDQIDQESQLLIASLEKLKPKGTTANANGDLELTTQGNKKQFPKNVLDHQKKLIQLIKDLDTILNGAPDCTNLGTPNKAGFVQIPKSPSYIIESNNDWGKPKFVCAILHVIADYKAAYPKNTVIIHDMSGQFGTWPGNLHLSHIHGQDVDIFFQGATPNNRWDPSYPANFSVETAEKLADIVGKYKYGSPWIGMENCTVAQYAATHDGFSYDGSFDCHTQAHGFGDHTTHWHIGFRT